jgi:hypothetical protein
VARGEGKQQTGAVFPGKFWSLVPLCLLLAFAIFFLVWDLRGARQLLIDSRQVPSRMGPINDDDSKSNHKDQPSSNTPTLTQAELERLTKEITNTERQLDIDEKRLDALRARAADIQLIVTILLGLGTLYAAAQALFAFLNIQGFVTNARLDVNAAIESAKQKGKDLTEEHKKAWGEFQAECRRQFPRFTGMANVMNSVFAELVSLFRDREIKEVTKNLFGSMSPENRQKVFFYEKSLAGLEYLEVQESAEELLQVFRGLGIFYTSKYQWEKSAAGPVASTADLDRGKFYFTQALKLKPCDFRILDDQGLVASDIERRSRKSEKPLEGQHRYRTKTAKGLLQLRNAYDGRI